MNKVDHSHLPEFFKNSNPLLYIATQTVHPLDRVTMAPLLRVVRDVKDEDVYAWVESSHPPHPSGISKK